MTMLNTMDFILNEAKRGEVESLKVLPAVRQFLIKHEHENINREEANVSTSRMTVLVYENVSKVPGWLDTRVTNANKTSDNFDTSIPRMVMYVENQETNEAVFYPLFDINAERVLPFLEEFFNVGY